ncbi:MAG: PD-(D/E)XK motif protein [Nannocystales bacterium]
MRAVRPLVEQSWELLGEVDAKDGRLSRALSEFKTPHGDVLLASDSDGTRHVLIPVSPDEEIKVDRSSQGVQLVRKSLIDRGEERVFIDVRCPKRNLYRVFTQIAVSMLEAVAADENKPPARTCEEVLSKWRDLLRSADKPVSDSVLRGAFGELAQLANLCKIEPAAVEWWVGPKGAPQDFISPHGALEIKTSGRVPVLGVSISGLRQLDDAPHDFLLLVVQAVASDKAGQTLGGLVDDIAEAGGDRESVLDKLSLLGIGDITQSQLESTRYAVTHEWYYPVADGFPRITPPQMREPPSPAIRRASYDIDLVASGVQPLPEEDVASLRRKFVGK